MFLNRNFRILSRIRELEFREKVYYGLIEIYSGVYILISGFEGVKRLIFEFWYDFWS